MDELEKKTTETAENSTQKKLEDLEKSLNFERSKRKELERKLASKAEDDTEDIKKEEQRIRESLKNGKSDFSDETIDDIMNAFGKSQAEMQVKTRKQNIEREILELQRDPMYMDVEEYKEDIRKLVSQNGLTVEQAYWAVAGRNKANLDTEEKEDKSLNKARVKEGYIDREPAGKDEKPIYTAKERAIANTLNISPEEAKARGKNTFSLEEILKMEKKFKKED